MNTHPWTVGTIKTERLRLPAINNNTNPIQTAAWLRFEITGSALISKNLGREPDILHIMEEILQDKCLISKCLHRTTQTTSLPIPCKASAEARELIGSRKVFLAGEIVPFGVSSPSERLEWEGAMDGTSISSWLFKVACSVLTHGWLQGVRAPLFARSILGVSCQDSSELQTLALPPAGCWKAEGNRLVPRSLTLP